MSDYKYIDPPEGKKVIWLRTINDAWHEGKESLINKKIPKNSITWVVENDIHKEGGGFLFLCEDNRHYSNYQHSDFEIISDPNENKEVLLTTIL